MEKRIFIEGNNVDNKSWIKKYKKQKQAEDRIK